MKKAFPVFLLLLCFFTGFGQELSSDFKIVTVNKKVREFPDLFDLSSPLSSCISFNYLLINGKDGLLRPASSRRIQSYLPDPGAKDSKVSEKSRNNYLDKLINEVVIYKDTIACVISVYTETLYSIRFLSLENSKWVNAGEDVGTSIADSRQQFARKAPLFLDFNQRIRTLVAVSTDTLSFINYLKKQGQEPKQFVLNALAKHKLVIFGEIHRRLWSWNLCKSIIRDPGFKKSTGTIFLEISAHKQNALDQFLAGKTMDTEIILDIFREIQSNGWYDKGMYEFILDVWRLNQTLPPGKRIKIIAADIPRPFSTFKTADEQKKFFDTVMDRNAFMSKTVETFIKSKKDKRNSLFIVGAGHAYKSSVPGFASAAGSAEPSATAGSLLTGRLPKGEVFILFTHCPVIDNGGNIDGAVRNGLFDYAFYRTGNKPIAFLLKNSPFGTEPFDALPEISYKTVTGTYADNYDGYIFLGPLETEPGEYILHDIYSDNFVKELIRRAALDHSTVQEWFGIKEATRGAIIEGLKEENKVKNRWGSLSPVKK